MKLTYIGASVKRCDAEKGETLADALARLGESPVAPCGGNGKCGKCRVACEGELSAPDTEESALLGDSIKDGLRLACRAVILGDVTVFGKNEKPCIKEEISSIYIPEGVLCVDLGTTYVTAAYSADGATHLYTFKNPQGAYGADVISRIASSEKHLEKMTDSVRSVLESIYPSDKRQKTVISGNTVMQLIYAGKDPSPLGYCPYESPDLFGYASGGVAYMPCIGGFVGGDVTGGLFYALQTGVIKEKTALYIDIGTNGETVLIKDGEMTSCATAAGPCFEGAGISCGMQAEDGAVYGIKMQNGQAVCSVIGDKKAKGICGSGAVSIVSHLLETGELSKTGLLEKEKVSICENVYITRKDIRMIQGAKAAVRAGISILCKRAGITPDTIEKVYVAGTFGQHLDVECAKNIGLLPDVPCEMLGNCSLYGACLVSADDKKFEEICDFSKKIKYVELSELSEFGDEYIDASPFER